MKAVLLYALVFFAVTYTAWIVCECIRGECPVAEEGPPPE